jgi:hypothetical protein
MSEDKATNREIDVTNREVQKLIRYARKQDFNNIDNLLTDIKERNVDLNDVLKAVKQIYPAGSGDPDNKELHLIIQERINFIQTGEEDEYERDRRLGKTKGGRKTHRRKTHRRKTHRRKTHRRR